MKALVTGITGQDGSYLAEFLLSRGYEVYGMIRQRSHPTFDRIKHILDRVKLVEADLLDQATVTRIVKEIRPEEIYNLASLFSVSRGWMQPVLTGECDALGTFRLLEAIRLVDPSVRFFQASSADMFGEPGDSPQTEETPFAPHTPYGVAKLAAHWMTVSYRRAYGLHAACGILYNHESPRRSDDFLSRKISDTVARIKLGLAESLTVTSLDTRREWGFAGDYVRAMWMMLQHETPDDFIVASGETFSVEEFCRTAFECVGLDWQNYVFVNAAGPHTATSENLCGNARKARQKLLWEPEVSFNKLVHMLVDAALERYTPSQRFRSEKLHTINMR